MRHSKQSFDKPWNKNSCVDRSHKICVYNTSIFQIMNMWIFQWIATKKSQCVGCLTCDIRPCIARANTVGQVPSVGCADHLIIILLSKHQLKCVIQADITLLQCSSLIPPVFRSSENVGHCRFYPEVPATAMQNSASTYFSTSLCASRCHHSVVGGMGLCGDC